MPIISASAKRLQFSTGSVSTLEGAAPTAIGQPLIITSLSPFQAQFGATVIQNFVTVGKSGAVQYSKIEDAIAAALAGGASNATPWLIVVYPGDYLENKLTIPPGIVVSSPNGQMCGVNVTPVDPNDHLIESTRGSIVGLRLSGVTGAGKALVYCATADPEVPDLETLIVNCGFTNAPIGVLNTGVRTYTVIRSCRFFVDAAASPLTIGVKNEAGAWCYIVDPYAQCEAAALALYPGVNPIETSFLSTGAGSHVTLLGANCEVLGNTATQSVAVVDDGAHMDVINGHIAYSQNAVRIGSTGTGSSASAFGAAFHLNTLDVRIEATDGKMTIQSETDTYGKFYLAAGAAISGIVQDETSGKTHILGSANYTFADGDAVDLPTFFSDTLGTGVSTGGAVEIVSGLDVKVNAGTGWINLISESAALNIAWNEVASFTLDDNATNYVYVSEYSGILKGPTPPVEGILLAEVITASGAIRFNHNVHFAYKDYSNTLNQYLATTRPFALDTGIAAAADADPTKFTVDPGSYYKAATLLSVNGKLVTDTFSSFYGANGAVETTGLTQLDITNYAPAGVLTPMTPAYYRADSVIITSDNRISVIYGTVEYSTQVAAAAAGFANIPTFIEPTGCSVANLIILTGTGIVQVVDARPRPAASGIGGGSGVTAHSLLSGLGPPADDHPQYTLANGTRALAGNWSLGGFNLSNAGTINSVAIAAHAARHLPGGVDALTTAAPVALSVGGTNAIGSATSYPKSDHVHAITAGVPVNIGTDNAAGNSSDFAAANHVHNHGAQTDPTQHAVATALANGFMTSSDFSKLAGLPSSAVPTTTQVIAGNGLTGGGALSSNVTLDIVANADGSIAVNANDIQVGILATDGQHGARGGGSTHAVAVAGVSAGFISAANETKLENLITNAVPDTRTISTTNGILGGGALSGNLTLSPNYGSALNTICQGNDSRLSDDRTASGLRSLTTIVVVSGATAPSAGQYLQASSSTAASWTTLPSYVPTTTTISTTNGITGGGALSGNLTLSPTYGTLVNTICQGNDSRLSDDRTASGLRTATTIVAISGDTAPTAGQSLVATSGTAATWQSVVLTSTTISTTNGISGGGALSGNLTLSPTYGTLVNTICQGNDSRLSDARSAIVSTIGLSTTVTTTSTTDVAPGAAGGTGLTLTPGAGNYLVLFSCEHTNSNNGTNNSFSIYVNGVQVAVSQRTERVPTGGGTTMYTTALQTYVTAVGAGQAIDVRWHTSANTATIVHRELTLIKAG